ncbi:MAG TPA: hypothetical protein VL984_10105 [Acidimicrobiales bacterium]|nr:hypothetical protein [Acidimicrobiales bacterium]
MPAALGSLPTRPNQRARSQRANEQVIGLALMVATSAIAFWDLLLLATNLSH